MSEGQDVPVRVRELHLVGEDERGWTRDFSIPRGQGEFIFLYRRQGSVSGNTYHEGTVSGTRPKIFLLASGSILFSYRPVAGESQSFCVDAPALIEIAPRVIHRVEAVMDVLLLEFNSLEDIAQDRHRGEI